MAPRSYEYQYDTNPRKIKPEYSSRKKAPAKKKTSTKTTSKASTKTKRKTTSKKKEEQRAQKILIAKTKFSIFIKCVLIFAIVFFILFRNSQISESFSKIQKLKSDITVAQKEKDQIEINIQNSMNSNNLEQKAKELLGMQKLTSKQIVYITIPKKDYVENKAEEIIIEEDKNFFESIIDKIKGLF